MVVSQKNFFMITFALTLLIKALDGIPAFGNSPSYFIYAFSLIWLFAIFAKKRMKYSFLRSHGVKIVLFLCLYFLVWGTALVAPGVSRVDISHELFRKMMMILFIFVSLFWISYYSCITEVIHYVYIFLSCYLLVLFVLHVGDINLSLTISLFWNTHSADRYRTLFGYNSSNIVAELAMTVILLSLIENTKLRKGTINKFLLWLLDAVMMLIIISGNSRGTFLASLIMLIIYVFFKLLRNKNTSEIVRTCLPIVVMSIIAILFYLFRLGWTFDKFLSMINRNHLLINVNIVNSLGRSIIGLGNLSGGYFSKGNYINGYKTDYMEMFYAGVFVRSGYIGLIIIILLLIYIFKLLVRIGKYDNSFFSKWVIVVFCYMIFISFFEQYLFSDGYASSMLFLILTLSYINEFEKYNLYKSKGVKENIL